MKWFGALLLISVTTWMGMEWSQQLNKRPKHIRHMKSALQILESEMLYSQLTIQDAFLLIAKQVPEPTKLLFGMVARELDTREADFVTIWESCVKKYAHHASLGKNELEILNQFGKTLGQHDLRQQQKFIRLTVTHLDRELEDAIDDVNRYGKMAKTLGLLSGLFIALLLL